MIESPWNFNYLIRTIWFFNVAKWRISMFHNKITVLIYISTNVHQFSSIFRYVKPFGACQSCYRSPLVTLGFLAPSCKEPGLLEPPWGSGASSAAWGKPVLLLWGCSLQWELPGICLFRFTIAKMRHILLGGCATPLKHMTQLELFFPIYGKKKDSCEITRMPPFQHLPASRLRRFQSFGVFDLAWQSQPVLSQSWWRYLRYLPYIRPI